MAANVTFNINAIDGTRKTFASVNQGLRNLTKNSSDSTRKVLALARQFIGIGAILSTTISLFRDVAANTEKIPGISKDTLESWNILKYNAKTTSDVFKLAAANIGGLFGDAIQTVKFKINEFTKGTVEALRILKTETDASNASLKDTPEYLKEVAAATKLFEDADKKLKITLKQETDPERINRLNEEAENIRELIRSKEDLVDVLTLGAQAYDLENEAAKATIALGNKYLDANEKRITQEGEIDKVFKNSIISLRELNAERERYIDILNTTENDSAESYAYLTLAEKELTRVDKERLDIMKRQRDIADDVGASIAGGFEEAIISGGNLRDVLKGILQDIIRIIIRNTITNSLATAISGGLSNLFGGAGAGSTPVPKRAIGGPVSSGSSYLVGERGPEIFTPSSGGQVISNDKIGGNGGGDTYIFNNHIASGVSRSELIPALEANRRQTIADLSNIRLRGGRRAAAY